MPCQNCRALKQGVDQVNTNNRRYFSQQGGKKVEAAAPGGRQYQLALKGKEKNNGLNVQKQIIKGIGRNFSGNTLQKVARSVYCPRTVSHCWRCTAIVVTPGKAFLTFLGLF